MGKNVKNIFVVGLKLLLICAVVAGVVSFVYTVTEKPYQANIDSTKREAVETIFGESGLTLTELDTDVYKVEKGGALKGYCAKGVGVGFNGDIELMVGYDQSFTVIGVSIVTNSETPGVGSRALEASYLERYKGQSGEDADVDALSGATYSSRGVKAGVKDATERLILALGK